VEQLSRYISTKGLVETLYSVHSDCSGVLRPGSTGFQDKLQRSYLHYISVQECATDFQSALKRKLHLFELIWLLVDHAY